MFARGLTRRLARDLTKLQTRTLTGRLARDFARTHTGRLAGERGRMYTGTLARRLAGCADEPASGGRSRGGGTDVHKKGTS